jgi:hypothetical protein
MRKYSLNKEPVTDESIQERLEKAQLLLAEGWSLTYSLGAAAISTSPSVHARAKDFELYKQLRFQAYGK